MHFRFKSWRSRGSNVHCAVHIAKPIKNYVLQWFLTLPMRNRYPLPGFHSNLNHASHPWLGSAGICDAATMDSEFSKILRRGNLLVFMDDSIKGLGLISIDKYGAYHLELSALRSCWLSGYEKCGGLSLSHFYRLRTESSPVQSCGLVR